MDEPRPPREMILEQELAFANAVGAGLFEKPKVDYWMILIPLLFLYFYYRLRKYKSGRLKFNQEFMSSRKLALDLAVRALETGEKPRDKDIIQWSGVSKALEKPYAAWIKGLVDYYLELLAAPGGTFEDLARSAYRNQTEFLLSLNRLSALERDLYAAIKPNLTDLEGTGEIIALIEERSRTLRRDLAESIFA
ncbi:MAG: NF038143 family protein [Pseudomonadota bacterium]